MTTILPNKSSGSIHKHNQAHIGVITIKFLILYNFSYEDIIFFPLVCTKQDYHYNIEFWS